MSDEIIENDLFHEIQIRDHLLKEAHELLASVLLASALQLDINPLSQLSERLSDFNKSLRDMHIIGEK